MSLWCCLGRGITLQRGLEFVRIDGERTGKGRNAGTRLQRDHRQNPPVSGKRQTFETFFIRFHDIDTRRQRYRACAKREGLAESYGCLGRANGQRLPRSGQRCRPLEKKEEVLAPLRFTAMAFFAGPFRLWRCPARVWAFRRRAQPRIWRRWRLFPACLVRWRMT